RSRSTATATSCPATPTRRRRCSTRTWTTRGPRAERSSPPRDTGTRRASIQPALELGERDEDPAPTPHDAQLVDHVLVEVVAADSQHGGCLVRAQRKPWPELLAAS